MQRGQRRLFSPPKRRREQAEADSDDACGSPEERANFRRRKNIRKPKKPARTKHNLHQLAAAGHPSPASGSSPKARQGRARPHAPASTESAIDLLHPLRPGCVRAGCKGVGGLAFTSAKARKESSEKQSQHVIRCGACGTTWQSTWWYKYLLARTVFEDELVEPAAPAPEPSDGLPAQAAAGGGGVAGGTTAPALELSREPSLEAADEPSLPSD